MRHSNKGERACDLEQQCYSWLQASHVLHTTLFGEKKEILNYSHQHFRKGALSQMIPFLSTNNSNALILFG